MRDCQRSTSRKDAARVLSLLQIAFILLMLVTITGAVMRGGPIERRGAALFFLGWTATAVAQAITFGLTESLSLFGIDLVVLIGLVALSWKSPRPWPVYACGFQIMTLAIHVAGWVDQDLDLTFRLNFLALMGFCATLTLAIGTWRRPKVTADRGIHS
jgi:hypothetical protein